ncbi:hypothetical protein NHX12_014356 [Muraenolepis orangiensis]|uniref:Myozenin n=1 Tax=Muraenolepis orangiensis TaxID=630683 RepID=A0A9Q0DCB3_9TELE|nr:hypothetical protein NHX12_014356 [Muraenolepis orangiensis]
MSQFSSMTTGERKKQAAAISREIYGSEDLVMDLGKKMCVPKEIMLEELSLASNRGSRLFKMRQKRSEKYTFESIQNQPVQLVSVSLEKECQEDGVVLQAQNGDSTEGQNAPEAPEAGPESAAPGYGDPLKDGPEEKINITAMPKSYHSPWDQALFEPLPDYPDLHGTTSGDLGRPTFNRRAAGWVSVGPPSPALPTAPADLIPESDDL